MNSNSKYETESDNRYDEQLSKIDGLTWLPWVGKKYYDAKYKILIVAESHYTEEDEKTKVMADRLFTRQVVKECPIGREWSNAMFDNLHRALVCTNDFDSHKIWDNVVFYNHVQRPMNYNERERPSDNDFIEGWKVFVDVVKAVRPDTCVFVGVAASNYFNDSMQSLDTDYSNVEYLTEYQKAYARRMSISIGDYKLPIHCINHSSNYFSWGFWHTFLCNHVKPAMEYLSSLYDGQLFEMENCTVPDISDTEWVAKVPTNLTHKPIVACNYRKIEDDSDVVYMTVGRATYDDTEASVKIWRNNGNRWNRSSEEVPITRLSDAFLLLLSTIKSSQNENHDVDFSYLHEAYVSKDENEIEFFSSCIKEKNGKLKKSLSEIKRLLNSIDLDADS